MTDIPIIVTETCLGCHAFYERGKLDALKRLPIDQAPRDGRSVLGFYRGWSIPKVIEWHRITMIEHLWIFSDIQDDDSLDANDATHFMYIAGE